MIFKTLTGGSKRLSKPKKYLIDWEKPSRSKRQFFVKQFIKKYWSSDFVFEEMPVVGTRMSFDFYNASHSIAIEVQGEQHLKYTPFFHGKAKSNFISQIRRDNSKEEYCKLNNIKFVEVYPKDDLPKTLLKSLGIDV
jgi:hypothetical protein